MSTNGDRKDIPERFTWKCDICKQSGKSATRQDAKDARKWHYKLLHPGEKP
jgi:hypothetical protein